MRSGKSLALLRLCLGQAPALASPDHAFGGRRIHGFSQLQKSDLDVGRCKLQVTALSRAIWLDESRYGSGLDGQPGELAARNLSSGSTMPVS